VYRQPVADDEATYGWRYGEVMTYQPGQAVTPLAAVNGRVAVEDLLP